MCCALYGILYLSGNNGGVMFVLPKGWRIVVIPSPYESWSDPQVQQVFCKTLEMRIAGYKVEYGPRALPVDGADFMGAHYLLCREEAGVLSPLMGFRSTTLNAYQRYGLSFGALSLARAAGAHEHATVIERILSHCEDESIPIAYVGSFTSRPEIRNDPEFKRIIRDGANALIALSHSSTGTRVLCGCSVRFKVDQTLAYLGGHPLFGKGGELPLVNTPFIVNEPVKLIYLKTWSEEAMRNAEAWRIAWDQRLILGASDQGGLVLPIKKAG